MDRALGGSNSSAGTAAGLSADLYLWRYRFRPLTRPRVLMRMCFGLEPSDCAREFLLPAHVNGTAHAVVSWVRYGLTQHGANYADVNGDAGADVTADAARPATDGVWLSTGLDGNGCEPVRYCKQRINFLRAPTPVKPRVVDDIRDAPQQPRRHLSWHVAFDASTGRVAIEESES